MIENSDKDTSSSLTYTFSKEELAVLAKFFRNYKGQLPYGISGFAAIVEKTIYNSMSIDEVERLYS